MSPSHVYMMGADGSGARRITDGINNYHSAVWSPDGSSVAYRRVDVTDVPRDIGGEVGILRPRDGVHVSLFSDESPPFNSIDAFPPNGPTWSVDGETIAFASRESGGDWAVWTISRSGVRLQRLLPDWTVPHHSPSFAPRDPEKLAMVAEMDGATDIWLVNPLAPSERMNLTLSDHGAFGNPRYLRWSPDERRIAFFADDLDPPEQGGGDREVYLLDVVAGNIEKFTDNRVDDTTPEWSPDGASLLIATDTNERGGSLPNVPGSALELWRFPLDISEAPVQLTDEEGSSAAPDWFPRDSCGEPR